MIGTSIKAPSLLLAVSRGVNGVEEIHAISDLHQQVLGEVNQIDHPDLQG